MGYKTKSMLKAIGSDYKPEQITSGTQPQAGAYSRGNKDWSAVKSAINIPDSATDAVTALGKGVSGALKAKKAADEAATAKKKLEDEAKEAQGKTNSKIPVSEYKEDSNQATPAEKLSMPQPVNLREDYEVPGNIAGQTASTPWFKSPLGMAAPDAFEKGMKRKARYTK